MRNRRWEGLWPISSNTRVVELQIPSCRRGGVFNGPVCVYWGLIPGLNSFTFGKRLFIWMLWPTPISQPVKGKLWPLVSATGASAMAAVIWMSWCFTEAWSDADQCRNGFCACYSGGNSPQGKAAGTSTVLQWTGVNWKGWDKHRKAVWPASHFLCFHCCHLSLEKSRFSHICVFKYYVPLAFFFLLINFRPLVFPKSFILCLGFPLLSIPGEFCLTKSVDINWPIINTKIK